MKGLNMPKQVYVHVTIVTMEVKVTNLTATLSKRNYVL